MMTQDPLAHLQQRLPLAEPYRPEFLMDEVDVLLTSIERDRWTFENLIIDPDYQKWLQERAIIRRVHSSTTIEGNRLDEEDAASLLRGEPVDAAEKEKREILNLKSALDFVDSIATQPDIEIDEGVIHQINSLVLSGEARILTPGEYRRGQNRVRNPMTGRIAYVSPNAGDVPALMREFGLWLRQPHEARIAPVIAGIAHLHFVEIHPFWDGNGRTARALTALILQRYGYGFNGLLSPERQFAWELRRYFEELGEAAGSVYESGRDLTRWLRYFLLMLQAEISSVSHWLVDFRRFMESFHARFRPLELTRRQVNVLAYTYIHGSLQARTYARIFGRSTQTGRRDIGELVKLGALKPVGQARARRYLFDPSEEFLTAIGGDLPEPAPRPPT
ncbi:MAG: Fic family protein [Chloroflexi bacterium]|nr:Fic family protein [Chloroflexota bacterium]